jgi:hypothetical protein
VRHLELARKWSDQRHVGTEQDPVRLRDDDLDLVEVLGHGDVRVDHHDQPAHRRLLLELAADYGGQQLHEQETS